MAAGYSARTSFSWKGGQFVGAARVGAINGVNAAIERLRGHSVEKAPVDQGDLRGSAMVVQASPSQNNPTAVLVFDEPYAAAQHEHEEYTHTAGAGGEPAGEAKYVQSNYEDGTRRQEYRDIIGRGVVDAVARSL